MWHAWTYDELLKYLIESAASGTDKLDDDAADAFYWSMEWRRLRPKIKARDHHECILCAKRGRVERMRLYVHHISPLKRRYDLRTDDNNLITLCYGCHELVHGRASTDNREPMREEWW